MHGIALSGFMGSGKTSIGKELELRSESNLLVDVDKYIREQIGIPIGDFIEQNGMDEFRKIETQAIKEVLLSKSNILALGGGAITIDENISILRDACFSIIYLDCPFELIEERLNGDVKGNEDRVSFDREKFKKLYESRQGIYRNTASIIIDGTGIIQETADKILEQIK